MYLLDSESQCGSFALRVARYEISCDAMKLNIEQINVVLYLVYSEPGRWKFVCDLRETQELIWMQIKVMFPQPRSYLHILLVKVRPMHL